MRTKMMVHGSQARSISSPEEVERLLAAGWLIAAPKPKTAMAKAMRSLRAKRRAADWRVLTLWVDPQQAAAIAATQRPGESVVEMIMRIIKKQSLF